MIDLSKKTATPASDIKLLQIFGQEAPVFVHNPNGDDTALAVVPLSFVQKIARSLAQAPVHLIKQEMVRNLGDVKTMAEYYELLENELTFNKTLEILANYTSHPSPETSY